MSFLRVQGWLWVHSLEAAGAAGLPGPGGPGGPGAGYYGGGGGLSQPAAPRVPEVPEAMGAPGLPSANAAPGAPRAQGTPGTPGPPAHLERKEHQGSNDVDVLLERQQHQGSSDVDVLQADESMRRIHVHGGLLRPLGPAGVQKCDGPPDVELPPAKRRRLTGWKDAEARRLAELLAGGSQSKRDPIALPNIGHNAVPSHLIARERAYLQLIMDLSSAIVVWIRGGRKGVPPRIIDGEVSHMERLEHPVPSRTVRGFVPSLCDNCVACTCDLKLSQ